MEGIKRTTFQGVVNIVRFNWQFYVIAIITIAGLQYGKQFLPLSIQFFADIFLFLSALAILISLAVSLYIYDLSNLYTLDWLTSSSPKQIVNINAGFDETSALLAQKYPGASMQVFDFYDPAKHTEVSIERARKAYPPYPGTQTISTAAVPLAENSTDIVFLILAAHEIRNEQERIVFFEQLKKALNPSGQIFVVEHQRDFVNFMAYNFGFFHFHSTAAWKKTFKAAGLTLEKEFKITPFISTFVLSKHGTTS